MARRTRSITIFAAILAALLAIWAPAALAHHKDDHTQAESTEDTKGNDRKGGYEDNSSEPQETNHGAGSDHDGDAGNESTAYTEDNDDDGRNNEGDNPSTTSKETYPNPSYHPSGKDRYQESGGSGNQGRSESNPDDSKGPMRYEGTQGDDKPNGPGGTDIYDQDGNNGCGNDQDFDDDNNGWCGKPTKVKATNEHVCDADTNMPGTQKCEEIKGEVIVNTPTKPCDADATMPGVQKCEKPTVVKGTEVTQPVQSEVLPEIVTNPSTPTVDSVLGVRVSAAAQPAAVAPAAVAAAPAAQGAVLPFTGASDLLPLVAVALMLIAAGALSLGGRLSSK